jgi:ribosomal protein S18 acetylase RimI-like enzyme
MGRAVRDSHEVTLRPLREEELPAFVERGRADYLRELVEFAGLDPDEAERKAAADFAPKPEHRLYVAEDAGRAVGVGWLGEMRGRAFVYEIWVEPEQRGKGYGRATMLALEEEARRQGFARIELNVWGGNAVARKLYRSLGYVERAVLMSKDI